MKQLFSSCLLGVLFLSNFASQSAHANPAAALGVSAVVGSVIAMGDYCNDNTSINYDHKTLCEIIGISAGASTTVAGALLKEMKQVQLDALAYEAGNDSSIALESVIAKMQASALENGSELSFEDAIDMINNLI
ncbi:MAG: hypothetical protein AB7I27_11695 [Bacteriovoracaceae bacterium]